MKLEVGDPKLAVNILKAIRSAHKEDVVGKWANKMLDQLVGAYTDPKLCEVWELTPDLQWRNLNMPDWTFVPLGLARVVPDAESLKEMENERS